MSNKELEIFTTTIKEILTDLSIKSIKTDWKECGEFQGDDCRPIFNIKRFKHNKSGEPNNGGN